MQKHEIKPIATVEEYEDATRRIATLAGGYLGTEADDELKALMAAVQKWDFDHDDATRWKD